MNWTMGQSSELTETRLEARYPGGARREIGNEGEHGRLFRLDVR